MNKFCLIILLISYGICNGQNLVPNGDYEIYGAVPCGLCTPSSVFNSATVGWNSPTDATPDIFSTLIQQNCSNYQPNSTFFWYTLGSQTPHSGNIFVGFYTFESFNTDYREYIQIKLISPMIPGLQYSVELFVSLADHMAYATNNIGMGFSTSPTYLPTIYSLGYTPQILFTNVVSDSTNWTLLKDKFVPSQPYEYIIIGNFFNNSLTSVISVNPGAHWAKTYYYCDDVSIQVDSTLNVEAIDRLHSVILYPNPIKEKLNIKTNNNYISEISIFDISSRQILQAQFSNSASINTEQLEKGIYLYEVRTKSSVIKKGKLVKD